MAEKTIRVVVDLPPSQYGFINGNRVYGGSEIAINEKQFSKRWMKRKEVPAPKSQPSKLTKKSDKSKSA